MRNLSFVILGLLVSIMAFGKTKKLGDKMLPNGLKVSEYRLDNGLQLLLVPDKSAPVFTYQIWFKVGSAQEKVDPKLNKTGLAHLFEHMMFRGTPKNPDKIFDQKLNSAGAVGENATTWLDRTNYFQSLPKDKLELVFDLESDRMVNLILNESLFKTETGAVLGERKLSEDRPGYFAYRNLWDLAFEKHPYKFTTIGTDEEIRSFTVSEGQYFYKTYYSPNNATIILLGDFEISQAIKLTEKYYGKMKSQEIPKHEIPMEPEQTKARIRSVTHPLASTEMVQLAYRAPEATHPDIAALEVIGASLSTGNGSYLQKNLVQKGLATSVSAGSYRLRYPNLFMLSAEMSPEKKSSIALEAFKEGLKIFTSGAISEEEITRAKNQLLLQSYLELEEHTALGNSLGEALVSSDNYLLGFQILEKIKSVSKEELVKVAKTYFTEEKSNTVLLTPGKGK